MPSLLIYRPSYLNQVVEFKTSVSNPQDGSDRIVYTDTSTPTEDEIIGLLDGKIYKYMKVAGNSVADMTQTEKDQVDADEAAAILTAQRAEAKSLQDQLDGISRLMRCVVKLMVDEINSLRTRDRDRAIDVANSSNLADLKTRWAAQSSLNDRTYSQAKTAIENLIDGE